MKRTLLFIAWMLASLAILAQENSYRPMVEEGKVWKVGYIASNPVQLVEYYYFDGDTIVDGKNCKQMMCQRFVSLDFPAYQTNAQQPSVNYVGAWYEEDKKVYKYDTSSRAFQTMYDFSLNDNDTLRISSDYPLFIVGPKQTGGLKGFKGVYREVGNRRDYKTTWLEGVGGITGPTIHTFAEEIADTAWLLLSCYMNDEVIYLNDDYQDGATPEIMNAQKRRFDFTHTTKLRPKAPIRRSIEQPLYGEYNDQQLGINLDPLDDAYLVHITDETGKVIYDKTINTGCIVALNINISGCGKGRHIVTVENSQETFTGEFEVQTTGISDTLRLNKHKDKTNDIYNLQGQRLRTLRKGLNIVNGKKINVR